MDAINEIAGRHTLPVIEDGAQSFGATYKGGKSGALSTIGSTSFFPSKPLGGYGDGGALFTDNDDLAKAMREIRVHGQDRRYHHPMIGVNGRLDTLQAAVLLVKLERFDWEIRQRQICGQRYTDLLAVELDVWGNNINSATDASEKLFSSGNNLIAPYIAPDNTSVYAQYTIQVGDRDAVVHKLKSHGIPTAVHYPVPLHMQPAFENIGQSGVGLCPIAEFLSNHVVSLPMHPELDHDVQQGIVSSLIG
jgi:UDP-2-acetamido-2-deoxy-ribo-hexuluronate aminotransferase